LRDITPDAVEEFIAHHLKRVSPSTVWHYTTDLKALMNFAKIRPNPVNEADLSPLRFRHRPKPPLNPVLVEKAAESLQGYDRAWFDLCRFAGLHKDEANGVEWSDVGFTTGWVHIRGTKNPYRDRWLPLHPVVAQQLQQLPRISRFVFPNRRSGYRHRVGDRQYSREKMFRRITKLTGIKLKPKDLRDYFATMVQTDDVRVLRDLMGHASLATTSKYVRTVRERMVAAVLGMKLLNPVLIEPTG
jgi:integrase